MRQGPTSKELRCCGSLFVGQEGKPLSSLPAPTPTDPSLDALLSATRPHRALPPRTVLHVPTVDVVLAKARRSGAQTPMESESDAGAAHPLLRGQIGQATQSPQALDNRTRAVACR